MRNMMGRSFNPSSFHSSKRNFQKMPKKDERDKEEKEEEILSFAVAAAAKTTVAASSSSSSSSSSSYYYFQKHAVAITTTAANKRSTYFSSLASGVWIFRLRSALAAVIAAGGGRRRSGRGLTAGGLPRMVAGTLFGRRRGRVRLAFQADPRAPPALLLELAAPTAALVREMASGLVRIALECDRAAPPSPLLEEPAWRAYCNGRKCGRAVRRECGDADRVVLRAVEAVSVGAGVLPAGAVAREGDEDGEEGERGDVMYMRAKFERVVGSSDSEAFYMISPDGTGGGPELSIYLLRV